MIKLFITAGVIKLGSLIFILIGLLIFLNGCASSSFILNSHMTYSSFKSRVEEVNSKVVCSYSGRVGVFFESKDANGSFGGKLNKTCTDNVTLSILGPLNSLYAQIQYKNGVVFVNAADNNTAKTIKSIAEGALKNLVDYMRYPLFMPDENGTYSVHGNYYVYDAGYDKDNVLIYFNKDFRVVGYMIYGKNTIKIEYGLSKNGDVKDIRLTQEDGGALVKFPDISGWSSEDDQ